MRRLSFILLLCAGLAPAASAQITVLSSFDPAGAGSLCGIGKDLWTGNVWVYPCSGTSILGFTPAGEPAGSAPRPGESANDVDLTFASEALALGGQQLPAGTLLFINGETGPAEVYAVDTATGAVIDTFATDFGVSHVVGGAWHAARNTLFLVQDNVPGAAQENRIAEVDPATGDTLRTFRIGDTFNVSYGDLDVSSVTGNLFVASSVEDEVAEYTPAGVLVQRHPLPSAAGDLSGLALDCAVGEAWASSTSGAVYRLGGMPCGVPVGVEADAPLAFRLSAVYPNPFRTEASFVLEVERAQRVRVVVYDLLGREVASVHDGPVSPGERVFRLGGGWPGGVYLVRVAGEHFSATRRIVRIE